MSKGNLILIGGGVRSGKSAFALTLARKFRGPRAFIATAQALDDEMSMRIKRHQAERGDDFEAHEEPFAVHDVVGSLQGKEVVVVDCLTLWLSNLLLRGDGEEAILRHTERLCELASNSTCTIIIVSNEVGMGVVPESPLGRSFRDLCGRAHQLINRQAAEVYFAALGVMLRLRPGPVASVSLGDEV
jgi:adenosylcobinamide kinase/adenosylcobinamide-phosphate guanylyltransferase